MAKNEKKLQSFTSFNSGEYSPSLAGRVDLQSHGSSARLLSNFMPEATGGIKKFYGTYHIADIENGGQILLIPFYNSYEPMCYVFTPNFIGVIITNDYFELSFRPLGTSDLTQVRWVQSNDKIFMVAPDMPMISLNFLGPEEGAAKYKFGMEEVGLDYEPFFPIGWNGNYNSTVESDGISGVVTIKIPEDHQGVRIDLPVVLHDSSQFNILGANNYMQKPSDSNEFTLYLGVTTASLIRNRAGEDSVLSTGIVSGSPVNALGDSVSSSLIKDSERI
jgi:hypothetical protein